MTKRADRRVFPPSHPRLGGNLYGLAILAVLVFFIIAVFIPYYFKMRDGIYRVSCKEIRRKVEVAVANFDSNNTQPIVQAGKPIDLDKLKASGFLMEIQRCSAGGKFLFGPQGEILCSIHRPKIDSDPNEVTEGSK